MRLLSYELDVSNLLFVSTYVNVLMTFVLLLLVSILLLLQQSYRRSDRPMHPIAESYEKAHLPWFHQTMTPSVNKSDNTSTKQCLITNVFYYNDKN